MGSTVVFAAAALLVLAGSLWVVTLSNLFRAALSLGLVLLGVAVLFILLEAPFLAFVQILVYVGAILTLVIFAVMLTATPPVSQPPPTARRRGVAAVTSLALFVVLSAAVRGAAAHAPADVASGSVAELGQHLITTLVLPFEVISLVFVASMVGAIVLAASRRSDASSS